MSLNSLNMTETVNRWEPIESSPEILTELCHRLGASSKFEVVDVYSLEPDMLEFIPKPVYALYLLFPSRDGEGERRIISKMTPDSHSLNKDVFFLDQVNGYLNNACGTIAVIHSLLNLRGVVGLENSDSPLEIYFQRSKNLDFKARGIALDADSALHDIHACLAAKGQSQRPDIVCHHYVCFVGVGKHLVELDGAYIEGPHVVEELKDEKDFLSRAVDYIKDKYVNKIGTIQFSLMALVEKS